MFHHSDLNAAGVTAHTPANGSDRAIKARNEALAAQCKADGQEVREPPPEERTAMILTDEQEKLERDLREVTGVTIEENVGKIKEAQFVAKDGQPTIQMAKPEAFQDIHQQASSLVHAASHAQLHQDAANRAARATAAGHTDEAAEARVAAYKQSPAQCAKSEEFSKADLAATHAAVNRTTAMPAVYVPPASTESEDQREFWAQTLEARGGMAAVSRDITTVERGFSDDRSEVQRRDRQLAREKREQERVAQRGQGRRMPLPRTSRSPRAATRRSATRPRAAAARAAARPRPRRRPGARTARSRPRSRGCRRVPNWTVSASVQVSWRLSCRRSRRSRCSNRMVVTHHRDRLRSASFASSTLSLQHPGLLLVVELLDVVTAQFSSTSTLRPGSSVDEDRHRLEANWRSAAGRFRSRGPSGSGQDLARISVRDRVRVRLLKGHGTGHVPGNDHAHGSASRA